MTIKELVEKAHENARKHGFWEDWDSICWEDGLPKREDSTLDMEELFNRAIKYRKIINGHIFCWYNNSPIFNRKDKRDKYGCWVRVCPTEDGEYVELGRG